MCAIFIDAYIQEIPKPNETQEIFSKNHPFCLAKLSMLETVIQTKKQFSSLANQPKDALIPPSISFLLELRNRTRTIWHTGTYKNPNDPVYKRFIQETNQFIQEFKTKNKIA